MHDACVKHSVPPFHNVPTNIEAMKEKIEKLKYNPNGQQLALGHCPFCIYELGFEEGKKASG